MSIEEFVNANGKKSYQYKKLDEKSLHDELVHLCESLRIFTERLPDVKFPQNVKIDEYLFPLLVVRLDKYSDYFLIFHEQTHINEIKKAALYAY